MVEDLRQHRDEDPAEHGAADRAEAADDDHREELDRQVQAEALGHDAVEDEGQQHAGQAGVHRGDGERRGLVALDVDAHDGGGDLAVAHGFQRAARAAVDQAARVVVGDGDEQEAEVPQALERLERHAGDRQVRVALGELEARDAERRRVAPVEAAGHPGRVEQDVLADEDEADRGDAEVDAAEPPGDRAVERAGQPGQRDGQDQRDDGRQAEPAGRADADAVAAGEVAVPVGADGGEERMGERQLARGPGEDVQADRADHRGHREQPRLQPERLEEERDQQRDDPEGHDHQAPGTDQAGEPLRHGSAPSCRTGPRVAPAGRAPSRCTAPPGRARGPGTRSRPGSPPTSSRRPR